MVDSLTSRYYDGSYEIVAFREEVAAVAAVGMAEGAEPWVEQQRASAAVRSNQAVVAGYASFSFRYSLPNAAIFASVY